MEVIKFDDNQFWNEPTNRSVNIYVNIGLPADS